MAAPLLESLARVTHWRRAAPSGPAPPPGDRRASAPFEPAQLAAARGAVLVKRGANRAVYRLDLPDRSLFVKHHRATSWRDYLRQLIRGSDSRREFDKSRALRERQVPSIRAVAYGERRRFGLASEHFLITEAIVGASTLADWLATAPNQPPRLITGPLVERLAAFCAAAHRAGVFHDDLHAGNILLQPGTSTVDPNIYVVDVPGVRVGRPLGWRATRRSLALLLAALHPHVDRESLARFWRAYLAGRPDLPHDDAPGQAALIVAAAQRAAHRVLARRDRRCWTTNRDFRRIAVPTTIAYAVADLPRAVVDRVVGDPSRVVRAHRDAPVKLSHSSLVVAARLTDEEPSLPVAFKRYRPRGLFRQLQALVGRHAAARAWCWGHALTLRGIGTARPLLLVVPRRTWPPEQYLATEWVAGSQNLHLWGWDLARREEAIRDRLAHRCAHRLGELAGKLHAWNLAHRDLKGCNLLVVEHADDVDCRLIDLDGLRYARRLSLATRSRNLARLAASAAAHGWISPRMKLRFLRAYRRMQPTGCNLRELMAAVERETARLLERPHEGEQRR